jgi:hypothetical protein
MKGISWQVHHTLLWGAVAGLVFLAMAWGSVAGAQPPGAGMPRSAVVMHDIQILETLRGMSFTADQRKQAAALIEQFVQERQAAQKVRDSEALVQALAAVRAALIKGQSPTPQMRQAVEAARPPEDGSVGRAIDEASGKALGGLAKLLTDDQKAQLQLMPLVGFANHVLGWSMDTHGVAGQEWDQMRLQAFGEMRERLRHYAGQGAEAVLANLQRTIDRLHETAPDQIGQQHDQLVTELVTTLKDALFSSPEAAEQQLRDQLWDWLDDARVLVTLKESAAAMGGQ